MLSNGAVGHGAATITDGGTVLDTEFVAIELTDAARSWSGTEHLSGRAGADLLDLPRPERDPARGVTRVAVDTVIGSLTDPPVDAHDVYLRLHLLSHRMVLPNHCNLDGIFGLL